MQAFGDGSRTTDDAPTLPPVPADLDAPRTKLVYLGLHVAGEATVDELRDRLDEPRLSLYPVLADLRDRGLVVADGDAYRLTT
jgi:hypothetical protein